MLNDFPYADLTGPQTVVQLTRRVGWLAVLGIDGNFFPSRGQAVIGALSKADGRESVHKRIDGFNARNLRRPKKSRRRRVGQRPPPQIAYTGGVSDTVETRVGRKNHSVRLASVQA